MTYLQAFQQYEKQLARPEELRYVFRHGRKLTYTQFIMMLNDDISQPDQAYLDEIFLRLLRDEPAQYIVGETEFADLTVAVDARALIPRPETEELVALILAENASENLKVLDIGTGTGVIALSLAKAKPTWQVTASDISSAALELAQENAQKNNVTNVKFTLSDVFSNISEKYDVIVSNPPYISEKEKVDMAQNVLAYEPHMALFAADEGLAIYKKIAAGAERHLTETGKIYLEIGHLQGQPVSQLFREQFQQNKVQVKQDLAGKDRMIRID